MELQYSLWIVHCSNKYGQFPCSWANKVSIIWANKTHFICSCVQGLRRVAIKIARWDYCRDSQCFLGCPEAGRGFNLLPLAQREASRCVFLPMKLGGRWWYRSLWLVLDVTRYQSGHSTPYKSTKSRLPDARLQKGPTVYLLKRNTGSIIFWR